MPSNYVLLRKVTLTATGTSSITFNNIPQSGYTDLKLVISNRNDRTAAINDSVRLNFNGVSTGYTATRLYGTGSTISADTYDTIADNSNASTANTFSNIEYYIPNYLSSSFKSYSGDGVMENNAALAYQMFIANLWSNTAAIHTIEVKEDTGTNFLAGSTISLYGIAALGITPVIAPLATGGDRVTTDGTYWYHTFISSGLFTPNKSLSADVLAVAGGGGGARSGGSPYYNAGGGGAGGVLYLTSQTLTASPQVVTVGAGGIGGADSDTQSFEATNGNNSRLGILTTAIGGGRGGVGDAGAGSEGGSGGGGSYNGNGGSGTVSQGNNGAAGVSQSAGGGGGAASAGGTGGVSKGGGATNAHSSLLSVVGLGVSGFIAGGGGGGYNSNVNTPSGGNAGGGGGAGNGGISNTSNPYGTSGTAATSATAYTGSGGGGAPGTFNYPGGGQNGGNGGSGFVVVRYKVE